MNEPDPLEKRVADLEALVSFQDRSLSQLDAVLTQFAARVERLEEEAKNRRAEPEEVGEQCDPPPHY
jgi:uncharacterized coiled-coil protein SlyX